MRKLLLATTLLAWAVSPSLADTATGVFSSDHCTGGCGTAPFASISVTEGTNSLAFTISMLNGNTIINTGFPVSFGFNLVGDPTVAFSGLTSGFSAVGTTAGSYQVDGFGNFEYGVLWNTQGGGFGSAGPLQFTITAAGLSLASLAEFSTGPGSEHPIMALDIFSGTTMNTGPVDLSVGLVPTTQSVPGPIAGAGLPGLLACLGLIGLGRFRRWRSVA